MEYTQEQVDEMLKKATEGLFTKEQLEREVTREVDRRVETGIQKGLETQRQKWEQEYMGKADVKADELAKKQFDEYIAKLEEKERSITRKANQVDAIHKLTEAGVPKSHYDKFLGMLIDDDTNVTNERVSNFVEMFNTTKQTLEADIKSQLGNVPAPQVGGSATVTKADFDKMSYADKMKFKMDNPVKFKEFMN